MMMQEGRSLSALHRCCVDALQPSQKAENDGTLEGVRVRPPLTKCRKLPAQRPCKSVQRQKLAPALHFPPNMRPPVDGRGRGRLKPIHTYHTPSTSTTSIPFRIRLTTFS